MKKTDQEHPEDPSTILKKLRDTETELKEARDLIREAEIIGKIGTWEIDIDTRKVSWSEGVYRIREVDDISLGINLKHGIDKYLPESKNLLDKAVSRALEFGEPYDLELELLTNKGNHRWVHTIGRMYPDERKLRGFFQDITERKQLEQELRRQAHFDYLTGINNRGHFMELAELELSRTKRYSKPLSILMIDIDYFKRINDTYGHKTGDAVLKKMAKICKQTLRNIDIIGRIGGEEFAILLPETDLEEAVVVAERLRKILDDAKVPNEYGGLPIQFTVSIGVSSLMSDDDNIDVLLNLSDGALYEAKETGRNKVCVS